MEINKNDIDNILWARFRQGEKEAFSTIFKNYYPLLFNYGIKIAGGHSIVEDCIQELFIDLWHTKGKADIVSLKAYIFMAFKFKLIKLINKVNKIKTIAPDTNETPFDISYEHVIVNNEQNLELNKKVAAAMDHLTPRQREIIYLKFYLNLSYDEVSRIMGINYQASRNLTYQAIKVLKKNLPLWLIIVTLLKMAKT